MATAFSGTDLNSHFHLKEDAAEEESLLIPTDTPITVLTFASHENTLTALCTCLLKMFLFVFYCSFLPSLFYIIVYLMFKNYDNDVV